MKLFNIVKNNLGFSLAEILISVAILGGVSVAVLNVMKESSKVSRFSIESTESDQLVYRISNILKDDQACLNTFVPTTLPGAADDTTNPNIPRISPKLEGAVLTGIKDKDNNTIINAGCVGDPKPCTYGPAGGSIFLKTIKIMQFGESSAPWNNGPNQATLFLELIKGGKESPETLDDKTKGRVQDKSFGQLVIHRKISLSFKLNSSDNILKCVTEMTNFLAGSCGQFRGTTDSDDLCKNVTFETQDSTPALNTIGDLQISMDASVLEMQNVGRAPPNHTGTGNINSGGDSHFKRNITTEGNLLFLVDINNAANYYSMLSPGVAVNTLQILGKNPDRVSLKLGTSGLGTSITGRNGNIGVGMSSASAPVSPLEVVGDIRVQGHTYVYRNARVGNDGQSGSFLDFGNNVRVTHTGAGTLQFNGAHVSINTPFNDLNSSDPYFMATQGWVLNQFLEKLGDQAVSEIINNILNNTTSDTRVRAIKAHICNSTQNSLWNGTECIANSTTAQCTTNELVRGFNNVGNKDCDPKFPPTQNCASYNLMYGVNQNGNITCADWRPMIDRYL